MTLRKFFKLYDHYKNNFDKELMLKINKITYAKYDELQMQNEEWL